MRFIDRLLQRVGLGLTCTRTEKVGDSKTRYYSINKVISEKAFPIGGNRLD